MVELKRELAAVEDAVQRGAPAGGAVWGQPDGGLALADLVPPNPDVSPPLFGRATTSLVSTLCDEWKQHPGGAAAGPASCLAFGFSATGKTRLAHWLSAQVNRPALITRADAILGTSPRETANNVRTVFDHAAGGRCILVLEEIDVFAPRRDDRESTAEAKAITSALLTCIAARRSVGLTLARTNEPNLLDPAVWPHFDVHLETLYLTFEVRVAIARALMDGKAPDGHLRAIGWATEGATAAEVEALVRAVSATRPLIGGKPAPLLGPLKASAMWRSQMDPTRRALLLGDSAPLFREWSRDPATQLSLEEIGEIAGRNKSSIGRQLAKLEQVEKDAPGDSDRSARRAA